MSITDPRTAYAAMTTALIESFRAHGGEVTDGPFKDRPVLLLTTRGARSGEERLTPVVYSRDGDDLVIVASKGGAPTNPGWYHNLIANPVATVEVGPERFQVRAEAVQGAERDRLYAAHGAVFPGFLAYQERTSRVIPVLRLHRII